MTKELRSIIPDFKMTAEAFAKDEPSVGFEECREHLQKAKSFIIDKDGTEFLQAYLCEFLEQQNPVPPSVRMPFPVMAITNTNVLTGKDYQWSEDRTILKVKDLQEVYKTILGRAEEICWLLVETDYGIRAWFFAQDPMKGTVTINRGLITYHYEDSRIYMAGWDGIGESPVSWEPDFIAAILMLHLFNQKASVIRTQSARPGLAVSKRQKALKDSTLIRIDLQQSDRKQYISNSLREAAVRHPRLHDVRGHERHYKSGLVVWVKAHERGRGEKLTQEYEVTQ